MPALTGKSDWYMSGDQMCQIWYFENGVELPWCIPASPIEQTEDDLAIVSKEDGT